MTLNIFANREEAIAVLARYFVQMATEAMEENGRFTVALSGGSSPQALYRMLAAQFRDKLDWSKVYFFFGDERHVPRHDPDSNYGMVRETLLEPLAISPGQVFPVDTTLEPAMAARRYQDLITGFFLTETPRFDLVLLGLGDQGQVASLYPGAPVLEAGHPGVEAVPAPGSQAWHISFTAPLINEARHIAFLVFGDRKAVAMQQAFDSTARPLSSPVQLIRKEHTAWFTDKAATALLTSS